MPKMTVKQLIDELSKYPNDMNVCLMGYDAMTLDSYDKDNFCDYLIDCVHSDFMDDDKKFVSIEFNQDQSLNRKRD